MSNIRDSNQFLQNILDSINDIAEFIDGMDFKDFPAIRKQYMP